MDRLYAVTARFCISVAILLGVASGASAQTYTLSPDPVQVVLDNSGNIVNAGCVWTYLAGTSTPATTYSTSSGTANANPIIADSAGRYVAYMTPGTSLKFVYENVPCSSSSHGTTLATRDNIAAVPVSGLNVDIDCTVGATVSAGDLLYISDGSNSLNAGQCYAADADLYYASIHPVLGFATAAITSGTAGTIRISGRITGLTGLTAGSTYYVSGTAAGVTATAPANARRVGQALSTTTLAVDVGSAWVVDVGQSLQTMDGRLTLTSALPVTTADVTAAATIYYTPYQGNRVTLFDGSRWKQYSFSELSLAVTCTAANVYDVWLYDNAGTLTLETLVWTNVTTRATALVLQNGVNSKTGALTRRYLGSFYCISTNAITDSFATRGLFNMDNRVMRPMRVTEATDTWTYSTATLQQARASTANQIAFVIGVPGVSVSATVMASAASSAAGREMVVSIGLDSVTATASGTLIHDVQAAVANLNMPISASLQTIPAVGYHYLAWLEYATTAATTTWFGDGGQPSVTQSGIHGSIEQ